MMNKKHWYTNYMPRYCLRRHLKIWTVGAWTTLKGREFQAFTDPWFSTHAKQWKHSSHSMCIWSRNFSMWVCETAVVSILKQLNTAIGNPMSCNFASKPLVTDIVIWSKDKIPGLISHWFWFYPWDGPLSLPHNIFMIAMATGNHHKIFY